MPNDSRFTASTLRSVAARAIWDIDTTSVPRWKGWLIGFLRISYAVVRDLADGQLSLRAMGLVYTTLLSLIPLLAFSFSVLKGLGVHNQIEPLLLKFLEPLGEKAVEISSRVIGFVENVEAGVLGSVGLALLIYTVVSLMQKIERAFNYTWHITRHRSFAQRFSDYLSVLVNLSVLVIGPVLVVASLGITASVMSTSLVESLTGIQPIGALVELAGRLVPYLLIIGAFTFVFIFMPNTKVRLRSALVGAFVAGILWETTGWAFASFIVTSTKYVAIYSAFATLIMFLIWLYLSWLILLVGASIAFYHQHPEYLAVRRTELRLSNRVKEKLALLVTFLIGDSYCRNRPAWTVQGLARRLNVPAEAMVSVLQALEQHGLLTRTGDEPPFYLPSRSLEAIEVKDVLDAVRAADEQTHLSLQRLPLEPAVEQLLDHLEKAVAGALDGRTLKQLASPESEAPGT